MNVASLELCKELYELSGWEDTEKWLTASDLLPEIIDGKKTGNLKREQVPAYDLGYLLRKLPPVTKVINCSNEKTQIYGALFPELKLTFHGDTPEDAACKLAIELFKQGVLPKEGL